MAHLSGYIKTSKELGLDDAELEEAKFQIVDYIGSYIVPPTNQVREVFPVLAKAMDGLTEELAQSLRAHGETLSNL